MDSGRADVDTEAVDVLMRTGWSLIHSSQSQENKDHSGHYSDPDVPSVLGPMEHAQQLKQNNPTALLLMLINDNKELTLVGD